MPRVCLKETRCRLLCTADTSRLCIRTSCSPLLNVSQGSFIDLCSLPCAVRLRCRGGQEEKDCMLTSTCACLPVIFTFSHSFDQLKSEVDKMKDNCMQVLAISVAVVVAVEAANYFLSYRRQSFGKTVSSLIAAVRAYASRAPLL